MSRKNNRVFENMYSMMVVPSWSTMCNDRIKKRGTSLGEMTFYCATNIKTWNGHKTNELVQTRKF